MNREHRKEVELLVIAAMRVAMCDVSGFYTTNIEGRAALNAVRDALCKKPELRVEDGARELANTVAQLIVGSFLKERAS